MRSGCMFFRKRHWQLISIWVSMLNHHWCETSLPYLKLFRRMWCSISCVNIWKKIIFSWSNKTSCKPPHYFRVLLCCSWDVSSELKVLQIFTYIPGGGSEVLNWYIAKRIILCRCVHSFEIQVTRLTIEGWKRRAFMYSYLAIVATVGWETIVIQSPSKYSVTLLAHR